MQEEGVRAFLASARESIVVSQQDIMWGEAAFGALCLATPHSARYDLRLVDAWTPRLLCTEFKQLLPQTGLRDRYACCLCPRCLDELQHRLLLLAVVEAMWRVGSLRLPG